MQVARWWIAPAVFALDRITKQWIQSTWHAAFPLDIWPGVLRLTYVHNTGAAFGLLRGRTLLLALLTLVTLSGLCIWLVLHRKSLWPLPEAALWMMVGGAVGNLFDRLLYGYVIDFIEIVWFQFPVFNVADAFITLSFILLVGWIIFRGDLRRNAPPVREDG